MKLASRQVTFASKIRSGGAALLIAVLTPIVASAQGAGTTPGIGDAPAANRSAVPATPEIGACLPAKVKYSASPMDSGDKVTTSKTFVNVPEASVNIVQGGSHASCIIVEFSALVFAPGSNRMSIRALLNNTTTAQPGEMVIATNDNAATQQGHARAVNFIFPLIEPGSHVLRMQYRSINGGGVRMGRHSTIVHYAP